MMSKTPTVIEQTKKRYKAMEIVAFFVTLAGMVLLYFHFFSPEDVSRMVNELTGWAIVIPDWLSFPDWSWEIKVGVFIGGLIIVSLAKFLAWWFHG